MPSLKELRFWKKTDSHRRSSSLQQAPASTDPRPPYESSDDPLQAGPSTSTTLDSIFSSLSIIRDPGSPDNAAQRIGKGKNLGVHILHVPTPHPDAVVDVVFIHGLTGNSYNTWLHRESGVHWPRDLVKNVIPNARILSWGYDADVASFWGHASSNQLAEHARNLLGDLVRVRIETNSEQRPLLFVVHSLGGLVIQKALSISRSRAESHLRSIEARTRGIAFMGTPHNGSDLAAWAVLAARLVSKFKDANVPILRTLERDSEILRDTQDAFGQLLRTREAQGSPIGITCFYEEHALSGVGMVVPRSSACLFGYDYYGIPNNHTDMPKFATSSDVGYQRVVGELKRWTWSLNPEQPKDTTRSTTVLPDFLEIMGVLAVAGNTGFHQGSGDLLSKSFSWLWSDTSAFVSWLKSSDRMFWVAGKPGSGKTTLMRHLVSDSSKVAMRVGSTILIAKHFFRSQAGKLERSIEGLLRSLAHQLLTQVPSLFAPMFPSVNNTSQFRSTLLPWSNEQLENSIRNGVHSRPATYFMFFVDGLDEFDGDAMVIARFLRAFSTRLPQNAKICVSGRPYSEFQFELKSTPCLLMESHTANDIEAYIKTRLLEVEPILGDGTNNLAGIISNKADGMFLWVRLAMDSLQRGWRKYEDMDTLIRRLQAMPRDLVDFYQRILDEMDMEDKTEAIRMLVLFSVATEELSCRAFYHAWSHTSNKCMISGDIDCSPTTKPGLVLANEESQLQALKRFEGRVYALTRSLIQVSRDAHGGQPGRFFLLHETVQAFVRQRLLVNVQTNVLDRPISGNGLLLHACVHYMDHLFNRNTSWTWVLEPKDVKCWSEWENDYFDLGSVYLNYKDYIEQCQIYRWTSPTNYPFDFGLFHYAIQNVIHHAQLAELEDDSDSTPCSIGSIMLQFSGTVFDLWRRLYQIHDARLARDLPVSLLALAVHKTLTKYATHQILSLPNFDGVTPLPVPLPVEQQSPASYYDYSTDPNYLLFQAAGAGSVDLARLLISKGAKLKLTRGDINRMWPYDPKTADPNYSLNTINIKGTFPIGSLRHWGAASLLRAVFHDRTEMVTFLLGQGALPVQEIPAAYTIKWATSGGIMRCRILSLDSISLSLKRSRVSISRKSLTVRGDPASGHRPSQPEDQNEPYMIPVDPDERQRLTGKSFNALYHAIRNGSFGSFTSILPFLQADPELHQYLNRALIEAASGGDGMENYVRALLSYGADAKFSRRGLWCDAPTGEYAPCYALVVAVARQAASTAIIMTLLQAGADPNFGTTPIRCTPCGQSVHGRPIDILLEQLSQAATPEREEQLIDSTRLMIKYGAKIDHDKWDTFTTPERKDQLLARIFPNGEGLEESALMRENDMEGTHL